MVNKQMKFLDNGDIRYEIVDETARAGLANKITSPITSGTEGQVLTIDANGNPKWDDTSDMSDYYTKSETYSKTEVDSLIESSGGGSGEDNSGLTNEIKDAILACFAEVVWTTQNGQTLYNQLEEALGSSSTYYTITKNLGNATSIDAKTKIIENGTYTDTFSPKLNYEITDITCTMGGISQSITNNNDGTYTINISEVTGNIIITITTRNSSSGKVYYTVSNNLTNCTNSNNTTTIEENTSYTATITEDAGYNLDSVIITMGSVDITNTVYANKTITISSVTGDIVITANAILPTSNYLYDYPFNGTIKSIGKKDLNFATYNPEVNANFTNDGTYDFLYGTSADDVLVADTPSDFILDGDFTISIYGKAEGAKGNNMLSWAEYVDSDMIPTKYNVVNSQSYTPTSSRRSKSVCGIDIFTDGNGLHTNLCNNTFTYGASIYGSPAKAECWDSVWHHYCLQRDNGVITMYFDKTPVWTIETSDTLYLGSKLAIGGLWSSSANDNTFKTYNTSQMSAHYHAGIRNLIIDNTAIDINIL